MTTSRRHISPAGRPVALDFDVLPSTPIRNSATESGQKATPIRPFLVLVVDDHPYIRQAIAMILKDQDMAVSEAENGQKATQKIMAGNFDLVISDCNMPEMDGMALLQWVKKNRPAMKVIMMSGDAGEETILKLIRAGATDFLNKPFSADKLSLAVDRCRKGLNRQPGQRQAISSIKQSIHDVRGGRRKRFRSLSDAPVE